MIKPSFFRLALLSFVFPGIFSGFLLSGCDQGFFSDQNKNDLQSTYKIPENSNLIDKDAKDGDALPMIIDQSQSGSGEQEIFTIKEKTEASLEKTSDTVKEIKDIQMLWIIDNSDSMKVHIDAVTKGLASFKQMITSNKKVLAKLGVVSCLYDVNQMKAPTCLTQKQMETAGFDRANSHSHWISSGGSLWRGGMLLCKDDVDTCLDNLQLPKGPKAVTKDDGKDGGTVTETITIKQFWQNIKGKTGALKDFFTPNHQHVIVVATDGSCGISDSQFFNFWKKNYGDIDHLNFYAFTAGNTPHCLKIATSTQGKQYDIHSNWGNGLKSLSRHIVKTKYKTNTVTKKITVRNYSFKKPAQALTYLEIGGKAYTDASSVLEKLTSTGFTVKADKATPGTVIKIKYLPK